MTFTRGELLAARDPRDVIESVKRRLEHAGAHQALQHLARLGADERAVLVRLERRAVAAVPELTLTALQKMKAS